MKYLIALLILSGVSLFANNPKVEKIDKLLKSLQQNMTKSPKTNLNINYDPFFPKKKRITHTRKNTTQKSGKNTHFKPSLAMILNNKAFINGKWYTKNQKVAHYMLSEIHEDYVVLTRGKRKVRIFINNPQNRLLTKEEH